MDKYKNNKILVIGDSKGVDMKNIKKGMELSDMNVVLSFSECST